MAFDTATYDGFLDEDDPDAGNKHLVIGFDRKANLIEMSCTMSSPMTDFEYFTL
jgi:hypothetical protein